VEDRVLQASVARILSAIYEPLFQEESYGFRPGRSAHDALRQLRRHIIAGKVMHVCEVDIRSYFDRVNHDWLRRMLRERVSDPVILRLVDKWLRAGVLKNGLFAKTVDGVPQGGPISPILANIYLHYVLDLWFNKVFRRKCHGEAYLVRYADDFVACFQRREDAHIFMVTVRERLGKFQILYWDGSGLWVLSKRLEKGTFAWPKPGDGVGGKLPLRAEALSMLIDGIDLRGARMRPWYERE
jgi:group II intron reverse transcriptase/maturase